MLMKKILIFLFLVIFVGSSSADNSNLKNSFYSSIESLLDGNFKDTDFSIKSREGNKPEIGILTFNPLVNEDNNLTFFQGSFFTHDGDRETLNLGLGKRNLSNDESTIFGINLFYDHELDYDHQRMSLGTEIKSSILKLNTNNYFAISDQKKGKNNIDEEVADGYDLEIGAHVPYIPSATIYAKLFEFEIPGGNDYEGVEFSSKIEVPNSGLNLEIGFTDFGNSSYEDQWFVNLSFSLNNINSNKSFISDEVYNKISMKNKMYEKVRRENIILKSKGFAVKAGAF